MACKRSSVRLRYSPPKTAPAILLEPFFIYDVLRTKMPPLFLRRTFIFPNRFTAQSISPAEHVYRFYSPGGNTSLLHYRLNQANSLLHWVMKQEQIVRPYQNHKKPIFSKLPTSWNRRVLSFWVRLTSITSSVK